MCHASTDTNINVDQMCKNQFERFYKILNEYYNSTYCDANENWYIREGELFEILQVSLHSATTFIIQSL